MTRELGINFPLETRSLPSQEAWVREVETLGFGSLWSSEARQYDGFTPLAMASQWTETLGLGCACAPAQTRGPATMAMSVAALAEMAPGRVRFGIGCSSQPLVELWNDRPWELPYQYTRDMATFLRDVLSGKMINRKYETFSCRAFKLGVEIEQQPRLLIAALREQMLRLAGRVGDGAILNFVAERDLATVVPLVKDQGDHKEIVLRLLVCPTDDVEGARRIARETFAFYLMIAPYRAHQEWLGRAPMLKQYTTRMERGDRHGALGAIPDEFIESLVVIGTPRQCRDRIDGFFAGGVDTVILEFPEEIVDPAEAVRELAPSRFDAKPGAPGPKPRGRPAKGSPAESPPTTP